MKAFCCFSWQHIDHKQNRWFQSYVQMQCFVLAKWQDILLLTGILLFIQCYDICLKCVSAVSSVTTLGDNPRWQPSVTTFGDNPRWQPWVTTLGDNPRWQPNIDSVLCLLPQTAGTLVQLPVCFRTQPQESVWLDCGVDIIQHTQITIVNNVWSRSHTIFRQFSCTFDYCV